MTSPARSPGLHGLGVRACAAGLPVLGCSVVLVPAGAGRCFRGRFRAAARQPAQDRSGAGRAAGRDGNRRLRPGEDAFANYIVLANWTDQGIRNFQDSQKRAADFAGLVRSMGGTVKDIYWTIGPYDIVVVVEAPDDETVTAAALKVSGLGNVRTTTLRAFSQHRRHRRA